jgi:two-component system cell cycle sensor histidine kinase/response regulator CckA
MGTNFHNSMNQLNQVLFEEATHGIFISDPQGHFLEVNQQGCELLGYSREELVQLSWQEVLPTENVALGLPDLKEGSEGQTVRIEGQIRSKDGHRLKAEIRVRRLADGRLVAFVQDIGEHQRAEEAQYLYDLLANHSRDIILVVRYNDGQILEANVAATNSYGYGHEEMLALSIRDLRSPETQTLTNYQMTQANDRGILFETVHRRKDGSTFPVEVSSQGAIINGTPTLISVIRDISDRRRAEAEIQKLAKFPGENPNPVMRVSKDGILLYANQASAGLLESWHGTIGQQLPQLWSKIMRKTQEIGLPQEEEAACGERVFSLVFTPIRDDGYVNVYGYDITERKRAEAARQVSEARLAGIINSAMDAIISVDKEQHIVLFNAAAEKMFGYRAAEMLGQRLDYLIPDRFYETHQKYMDAFERSGVSIQAMGRSSDIIGRRANGEEFPLEASISQIEVAGAKFYTVIHRDITERQQAEAALQESEERFRLFMDNSPTTAWIKDDQGRYVYFNQTYENRFGLRLEEWRGKTDWEMWPPEVAKQLWQNDQAVLAAGHLIEFTEETLNPAGRRCTWWSFKFPFRDASGQRYVAGIALDITERQQIEEALYLTRFSMERAADSIYWLDEEGCIVDTNETACRTLGYSREELLQLSVFDLDPELSREVWRELWQRLKHVQARRAETTHRTKDGRIIPVEVVANFIEFGDRTLDCAFVRDISERKQAEEAQAKLESQLRQAQKMESIGLLAGGVAHDFNNLLTVIGGYSALLLSKISRDDPMFEPLEQIRHAGDRAAALTRQLLAFSRKQMLAPTILDLNDLITNLNKMLGRLIGEDIRLTLVLQPELWSVTADPGQIEQVIMNLVINARDAMPTGGMLTLETGNVQLDGTFAATHPEAPLGPCVMLTVTDTGHGMDGQTKARIFEPFFTTKEIGQGTGLGLATVYGIVKQSGGDILVYSEPGQGTTFKLYLPANKTAQDLVVPETPPVHRGGSEIVLLVEDEEVVRSLVERVLKEEGYAVLQASDGNEALSLAGQYQGPIDLLLTDVVMPQMSGRELAEQIRTEHPGLKVLFMSGYTDDTVVRHGLLTAQVEFLSKPFSPSRLASKVREILDK